MSDELVTAWFDWKGSVKCNYTQKLWLSDELRRSTDLFVSEFRKSGIREGDTVGVMLANTAAFPVVLISLLMMDCNPVLLHGGSTSHEMSRVLEGMSCRYCIHDFVEGVSRLQEDDSGLQWLHRIMMGNLALRVGSLRESTLNRGVPNRRDSDILHLTSGTYGPAKYCIRPQLSAVQEAIDYISTIAVYDKVKVTVLTPLNHAFAFGFGLVSSLLTDSSLSVYPYFNSRKVLRSLSRDPGNVLIMVPPMMDILIRTADSDGSPGGMPEHVFYAGTRADPKMLESFEERFRTSVWQIYGTTETGGIATNYPNAGVKALVGKPLENVRVEIASKTRYEALSPGTGEVVVTSPSMMKGYIGDEPVHNNRWNTGDLGYLDDSGNLMLVGRKRDIINVGGSKVDPAEVENILLLHENIRDAVVYPGINDKNEEFVQAAIVPDGRDVSLRAVNGFCHGRLSTYKVPMIFHILDDIPRSPSGKALRALLPGFPFGDRYAFLLNEGDEDDG